MVTLAVKHPFVTRRRRAGGWMLRRDPPEVLVGGGRNWAVTDMAYVLLLVGGFLMLALTLRGLERL